MQGPDNADKLHVGWHELHPDVSLNFQLNRWAAYGGPGWLADVRPVLATLVDYERWRGTFFTLGERAAEEGRTLHAALHFRAAEFFMLASDPRKEPLRIQVGNLPLAIGVASALIPELRQRDVWLRSRDNGACSAS